MCDGQDAFERAKQEVQRLRRKPGPRVLLSLYAHYKQAVVGDADPGRTGVGDWVGREKHHAWQALAGMARTEARHRYVELVEGLKAEHGVVDVA